MMSSVCVAERSAYVRAKEDEELVRVHQTPGVKRDVREGHHHLVARLRGEVANDALEVRVFVVEPPELDEHLLVRRERAMHARGKDGKVRRLPRPRHGAARPEVHWRAVGRKIRVRDWLSVAARVRLTVQVVASIPRVFARSQASLPPMLKAVITDLSIRLLSFDVGE